MPTIGSKSAFDRGGDLSLFEAIADRGISMRSELMAENEFPTEGVALTLLLVVSDMDRSRHFYRDVLGATVYREYGGTSCVLSFQGTWLLLVTGGGPTKDKPTVTFAPPTNPDIVSHELTIRVPDCQAAYEILKARGAIFLTPPVDWGGEIRCFFRDPDGNLLEISEAK
jgi:catechol 2,3-dioxygenase-like lactoylglutathione lyase family enzyme